MIRDIDNVRGSTIRPTMELEESFTASLFKKYETTGKYFLPKEKYSNIVQELKTASNLCSAVKTPQLYKLMSGLVYLKISVNSFMSVLSFIADIK